MQRDGLLQHPIKGGGGSIGQGLDLQGIQAAALDDAAFLNGDGLAGQ